MGKKLIFIREDNGTAASGQLDAAAAAAVESSIDPVEPRADSREDWRQPKLTKTRQAS